MTSRELISGFNFWSRGHLRTAVLHLPVKLGANIFIQSGVIDIFSEIQDGGRRHLGFSDYVNLAIRVCWQCGICVVYQIGLKYMHWLQRSTHVCFRRWFDDVTRINFRFRRLVSGHLRMTVMHLPVKCGADIFIQSGVIDIFPKFKMTAAAILDLLGKPWDHPRRHTCGAYSLLKFRHDRISSFQVIRVWNFCRSGLKVLFTPPKFEFLGSLTP